VEVRGAELATGQNDVGLEISFGGTETGAAGAAVRNHPQATPFLGMDWPLIRFLVLIFCLVATGVGFGYVLVANPDWHVAEEQKVPTKISKRD
jgi:hypothetical protein